MEKRVWTKPLAQVEQFLANEYVAACGDSGITYKFKCTAGDGEPGRVTGEDGNVTHYAACNIEHTAESTDDFINGTYEECTYYNSWFGGCSGEHKSPVKVVIWRGEDGDNTHCTTLLNKSEWETAKS